MSCESCFYDGNRYEFFVSNNADFNDAQNNCEENGGSLAKHLDKPACIELHKCCHDGNQYRIGLIADDKCSNHRPTTPFRWIGEDSCKDSSPFENINPTLDCQAARISLSSHVDGNLPQALLAECGNKINYICQYPQGITTTATTIATPTQNPSSSTIATTKTAYLSNPSATRATTFKSTASQAAIALPTSTSNVTHGAAGATAGLVVGSILGILIFFIGIFYYNKKKKQSNETNEKINRSNAPFVPHYPVSSNKVKETVENPIYSKYDLFF